MNTVHPATHLTSQGLRWQDLLLALAVALFSFGSAWVSLGDARFGVPPDEWAHATHLHEIAAEGRLIPDYADSHILPARVRGNYLSHPPLYYTALGLAGRALGWDAVRDYRAYRAASALLVAFGMLLWMLAGRSLGVPIPWLIAIAAATNAIPMFPFLAGSINSDNMAYLGVAIAFYGLVQLRHWPRAAFYIGAAGVAVVFLSKATAALFLCVFFALWAWPELRQPGSRLRSRHLLLAVAATALVTGAYYAYTLYAHGSPFPRTTALYAENRPGEPLAVGPFALEFARQMLGRLPTVTSHASFSPLAGKLTWVFWCMLLAPLVAWFANRRGNRGDPDARMANAFLLALALAITAHVFVVWRTHLFAGVFAGMQPRYYGYALPGLFIFCFLRGREGIVGKAMFGTFALCAALLVGLTPGLSTRAQVRAQAAAAAPATHREVLRVAAGETSVIVATLATSAAQAGYVDTLRVEGTGARIVGWAVDGGALTASRGLVVMAGDQVLGTAETGQPRPDVAKALKNDRAGRAGFDFTIERLPEGTSPCDIRVFAEQGNGTLTRLAHPACAAPPP